MQVNCTSLMWTSVGLLCRYILDNKNISKSDLKNLDHGNEDFITLSTLLIITDNFCLNIEREKKSLPYKRVVDVIGHVTQNIFERTITY